MDYNLFFTENKEFIVEIYKEKRFYGFSEFGQYICHLTFNDILGTTILDIQCTEKQLFDFMNILYDVSQNIGSMYGDNAYFTVNNLICFIMVKDTPIYPCEEDPVLTLQFFEDNPNYGRISRLYLEMTVYFVEDFVMGIFEVLSDIPYLKDMNYSTLLEQMGEYDDNE